jgi:hypothetical protein
MRRIVSSETELNLEQTAAEISDLLSRRTRAKQEGAILNLIRLFQGQKLADLLDRLELERLLGALDDRRWGPDSRKEFLRLLGPVETLLSLDSKARLIRSLARRRMGESDEKFLTRLFLSESKERLTRLKLDVDQACDGHDLLHILYNDIKSADLRFDLVRHFQNSSSIKQSVRVVSDIDDTLYSSLNDPRYSRGTVYPGVLEMLGQLSVFPPVFLTARPEFSASLFEKLTHRQLSRYGIEGATVLSGSIPGLFGYQRMAKQKARTLMQYTELYPEFSFLFIGDSGQGDMALAQTLLGKKPPPIVRALIHKLSDTQPGSRSDHALIQTFDHYGQAAAILGEHGFLSSDQVAEVHAAL